MKKFYFLLTAFCLINGASAQIINFPDANFKNSLLASGVDLNSDGEIDRSEALSPMSLYIPNNGTITDLSGIEFFTNLTDLYCSNNQITSLNISTLTNLTDLHCDNNQLTSLDLSNLHNLTTLRAMHNNIASISLENLPFLESADLRYNQLLNLTVTNCPRLYELFADYNQLTSLNLMNLNSLSPNLHGGMNLSLANNNLISLFLKNNQREEMLYLYPNPNLQYICTEESELANIQTEINNLGYGATCNVNSYCTFEPGGTFYTIQGNNKFDLNSNGCDGADLALPNLRYGFTNGTLAGSVISNTSGAYSIPVQAGTHTLTPLFENPTYFNVSPPSINVTFPAQTSPHNQNFCVTANGLHPDFEVTLLPMGPARPGFDADYKLIYKNKGNMAQSGTVALSFLDSVLDFVSAAPVVTSQALNTLTWDFTNLQPFETREISITLNVNSPTETPAVNGGDQLDFSAVISSVAGDETLYDNTSGLKQLVVNAYDPNDKTCLEGATIAPGEVGKYVHYMIRFENTGTFPAENIVVKDMIDTSKFDINTLVPTKGSHSFVTNITAGNKVEFIFENINLPFDNANNDGYVAFKIKTKPTLVNGDTFSNTANIYFDYNFPIVTNTAVTTIAALSTQDFGFESYFSLYPNPVNDVLNIETKQTIEVSSVNIYNQLGQLVLVVPNAQNISKVDVSQLASGSYFVKVNSDKGASNTKFIKS